MIYYSKVRDKQRAIPQSSIKLDINRFAKGVQAEQRNLASQFLNGQITPQRWYDESARLLKLSYRASVDIARGGSGDMTEVEKRRWVELSLLFLLLLNQAAENLNAGNFPLDGRFTSFAGSLGAANNDLYENWRFGSAVDLGYTEGRRVLGVTDHCHNSLDRPGCIELAARGWVPINELVPIGGATCRRHCHCTLEFRGKPSPLFG
jgi:hypothetical protein